MPSLDRVVDRLAARREPVTLGQVPDEVRDSAVLCVLYDDTDGPHVLLTRRSPKMRHHAHEISFPGGRRDDTDPDLWSTALREAEEEVALDPGSVTQIGALDRFTTVGSRTLIHPYVAVSETKPDVRVASPGEVEEIVHVSLAELLSDIVWREEIWTWDGATPRALSFFEIPGDTIWGATGSMLRQLLAITTGTDDTILGGPG
ncbi:MAG: CoA pyrophosphatase [Actinomycetota bacterium]